MTGIRGWKGGRVEGTEMLKSSHVLLKHSSKGSVSRDRFSTLTNGPAKPLFALILSEHLMFANSDISIAPFHAQKDSKLKQTIEANPG